jgi:DNA-binding response OmpR family regulator
MSSLSDTTTKTIMVIEDDQDISDALGSILKTKGYSVIPVRQVDDRFDEHFVDSVPQLILLDIWVGGGDGRDVAKKLRSQDITKHIPIIVISANISTPQIAQELDLDDFILKPFDVDHLLATVEKHLIATQ